MELNYGSDEHFMREALKEAKEALAADEIPVGAVIVHSGKIIARGRNMTEKLNDVTAHAEMLCFTSAANYMNSKYLKDCTLYVTLEPCVMCAGASFWTQIPRIVFGASDEKRGYTTIAQGVIHKKTQIKKGVLEEECSTLLKDFFKKKRK